MSFLQDAINHLRQTGIGMHGKECICQCNICGVGEKCTAHTQTYSSLTKLWELVLCLKPGNAEFFALTCLMGGCKSCGPSKKLSTCPMEESSTQCTIKVKIFEDIQVGETDSGKKKKRKVLSHKEMQPGELIDLFRDHLQKFIKHNFIYRWQVEQFKECLHVFLDDVAVSIVDFA